MSVPVMSMGDLAIGVKVSGRTVTQLFRPGVVAPVDAELWAELRKKPVVQHYLIAGVLRDLSTTDGNAIADGDAEVVLPTPEPVQAYAQAKIADGMSEEAALAAASEAANTDRTETGKIRRKRR